MGFTNNYLQMNNIKDYSVKEGRKKIPKYNKNPFGFKNKKIDIFLVILLFSFGCLFIVLAKFLSPFGSGILAGVPVLMAPFLISSYFGHY